MEQERRRSPRIREDLPVRLVRSVGESDVWAGRVHDISEDGVRVHVDRVAEVGWIMYAGFFLDLGGRPLVAKVRVAWTRCRESDHVLGLGFLSDSPAQRQAVERIRDYLTARRQEITTST